MTRGISLSNELHILIHGMEAIRTLAEHLTRGDGDGVFAESGVPRTIAANLVVLRERLVLLDRAVRDVVDPALLWCAENKALPTPEPPTDDDHDIMLGAWSDKKAARRLRRSWKAAKKRLRRAKER
jgi:hypothetical protein